MEKQTLLIGTVTSGNGGIVQDDRREVEFEGELLASRTEYGTGRAGGITDTRGVTETLYRLNDRRLLVHVKDWSHWQGEPTTEDLWIAEPADLEPGGRFEALGAEAGFGRPLTVDEALSEAAPIGGEPALCVGYFQVARPGDLEPGEVACLECDRTCEGGIWLAAMQTPAGVHYLAGPYCELCASSD